MAKLVNWYSFERMLREKNLVLFTSLDIRTMFGSSKIAVMSLLHRYVKRGFITRLKKGLYALSDAKLPDFYLANKLYEPSYISLEFALSYHRVIPETVYEITSVTTKSTQRFTIKGKVFTYRRIKQNAFTGYVPKKQEGLTFLIAEPEKAFVDLNYLRVIKNKKPLSRFDREKINISKALQYAALFHTDKLIAVIKTTLQ